MSPPRRRPGPASKRPGKGRGKAAPVDLGRERRIRAALSELGELVSSGAVDPERTRAYVAGTLPGAPAVTDAPEEVPTSLRLPRALVARLDALAARMAADPTLGALASDLGGRVSRSAVLRLALTRGIAVLEAEARPAPVAGPVSPAELLAELDALRGKVAALVAHEEPGAGGEGGP